MIYMEIDKGGFLRGSEKDIRAEVAHICREYHRMLCADYGRKTADEVLDYITQSAKLTDEEVVRKIDEVHTCQNV